MSKMTGAIFSTSKYSKTRFRPELCHGPRWGAYDARPDTLVGWEGERSLPIPFPLDAFGVSISAPSAPRLSVPPTQIPGYAYGKGDCIRNAIFRDFYGTCFDYRLQAVTWIYEVLWLLSNKKLSYRRETARQLLYARLSRLARWSCTSLLYKYIIDWLPSYRYYQLTNRATYVADEAFKHYILSRSSVFVSLESR